MEWKTAMKEYAAAMKAEKTATIHWSRAQMRALDTMTSEDIRAADRAWTASKRFSSRRVRVVWKIYREFHVYPRDYEYYEKQLRTMNSES